MPEQPPPKPHAHPYARPMATDVGGSHPSGRAAPRRSSRHVELAVTSNFTFLTGASHPEELVEQAAALGYEAIAITDRHTLAGIVRAHVAARERGIRLIVGSRIAVRLDAGESPHQHQHEHAHDDAHEHAHPHPHEFPGDSRQPAHGRIHPPEVRSRASQSVDSEGRARARRVRRMRTCELLLHATDLASYAGLCRLLTRGKRRAEKGGCILHLHDLLEEVERIDAAILSAASAAISSSGAASSSALGSARSGCGLLCTLIPPPATNGPGPDDDDDDDRSSRRHWLESWDDLLLETVRGLRGALGDRLSLAVSRLGEPNDEWRVRQTRLLGEWTGVPIVAINDVHYHTPERRPLQDVLACIRRGCTVESAGAALFPNAERFLRPPEEMADLFRDLPEAIDRARDLAERAAGFSLDQLRYRYPSEVVPEGTTPIEHLRRLAWRGAEERYPRGVSERVRRQIEHELRLIDELAYASYFLTVHDLVAFARGRGILCQGRGAAANSAVCYCLGVTAVDPDRIDVLFERFVSKERNEPPDIDIDFEHERREEVIQYLYRRYGRDRAALAAEVISYRGRSAVREVGKVLGLSLDLIERLASGIDWWQEGAADVSRVRELGLDPHDSGDPTMRWLARLTTEILGFPRHLSQHVGGFVITDGPLCEFVPIENAAMEDRTVIEWDKDDIDAMGMLKVDVLGLGMLTCIRKCIDLVNEVPSPSDPAATSLSAAPPVTAAPPVPSAPALRFHEIPAEDPAVYDMICAADTVGVFQIESRAQMSMLPRLRPRSFYDLVIEVAIVRPGPIQGDMVHPYLRRRNGEEPIAYPDEAVRAVLGKTLGVPLFQEQAMSLAIVAAGFTPGEADQLRRAIAAWKRKGSRLAEFAAKLEEGMVSRGYTREFARQVFRQIQGFSGYGFPESHAASFALLVYASAWLKRHHPAAFAASLINSQPMGFYAPAQIVRDAIDHGVEVRGIDVNASAWDCTLEQGADAAPDRMRRDAAHASRVDGSASRPALRLGLRLVRGLRHDDAERVVRAVAAGGTCATIEELRRRSGIGVAALRRLASADAFRSMGFDRQHARWRVQALRDESLPLFDGPDDGVSGKEIVSSPIGDEAPARLPAIPEIATIAHDYATTGLSLKRHPMACIRPRLTTRGVSLCAILRDPLAAPPKRRVRVAGLVLVRQRPSTANGIVFMTLEDESGIANLILRPRIYTRCRRAARSGVILLATGRVERRDGVVHLLAERVEDISAETARLGGGLDPMSRDFR